MKKSLCFFLSFLVMNGLVSCNTPIPSGKDSLQGEIEQQYQTVSVLLTQTAQAAPASTKAPAALSTITPTVMPPLASKTPREAGSGIALAVAATSATFAPTVPATSADASAATSAPEAQAENVVPVPCDLAQLGYPIDINVPDGSRFLPGEYFSKTWRLVNSGGCQWTQDFALVWFSGTNMGLKPVQPLGREVSRGSSVDVTVDMIAPPAPGTYQSNWKMRSSTGELFGIGPNGDAPIWVRIVVVPADTPTVTPTIDNATPTPVIYASGSLELMAGEGVDLDSARINQEQEDDLRLVSSEAGGMELMPLTGAHLVSFGASQPQMFDCSASDAASTPVILEQDRVGTYLCYRTTKGLPGSVTVKSIDLENKQVNLEFITWVVP